MGGGMVLCVYWVYLCEINGDFCCLAQSDYLQCRKSPQNHPQSLIYELILTVFLFVCVFPWLSWVC